MIKKKLLPMLLAAAFIFCMLPSAAFAAPGSVYDAGTPEELSAALKAASAGGTIRLTADIDYNTGISVAGKTVIFDLSGHTLNVSSSTGHGLDVINGGVVDMKGSGALNVSSSADLNGPGQFAHGVYAFHGGKATVTSASTTTMHGGSAACANGEGSCVTVTGDVTSPDAGAAAYDRGHVIVEGNVTAGSSEVSHPAIYAFGNGRDGSLVEVAGNVTAPGSDGAAGVRADIGGTIRVNGNITGFSNGIIGEGGTAWVGGSVTAKEWGVSIIPDGCSDVKIDGTLTAPIYIEMGEIVSASAGKIGTGENEGYLVYTDGKSTVRVKTKSESVSPAAPPAGPGVHDAGTPVELSAALRNAVNGDFIRLTADINYKTGITVTGKAITFDLNGNTLNVVSTNGHALTVGDGGSVGIKGKGALNVTSNEKGYSGVYAYGGGQAEVTSAKKSRGAGALATGTGSYIRVAGDVEAELYGAVAEGGGTVIVGGNAVGGVHGVDAKDGGHIEVSGNVTVTNAGFGIYAEKNSTVEVGGSVTCGTGAAGVYASTGSTAVIDGTITARVQIELSDENQSTSVDSVPGKADNAGYLVYTDGSNTVRVKMQIEIEKEVIDIAVRGGCSYVTCTLWFHNNEKSANNLLVGFPAQYPGNYEPKDAKKAQLQWFRTFADGKRVSVSVKKGVKPEDSSADGLYSPQWYTWRMHFAANERIKVVNKYWMYNTAGGADVNTVYYILRGGVARKEPIGKLTVRMHPEDFELESTTFKGMQPTYIEENGTIVWEAENIEPAKDIKADGAVLYGPGGANPFAGNDGKSLPYRAMTLRMLRNFYAGHYNGATWWGNRMFRTFGAAQSSQLYYCMGVSYYKLGFSEKALDMFSRIRENDVLYGAMSAYYKALICKEAGDDAGYRSNLQSIEQYLYGISADKMNWGEYWLKSRLADITKQQSS